jgi:hypothetical protein
MSEPSNPLADEIREARKPRLNLALPPRPDVPDEAVEEHSREIGSRWGANTQMDATAAPERQEPTAPLISVRFDCPDYVDRAISVAAAEQNVTKTYLILKALKTAGYDIKDVDLVVDRRRDRKMRGRGAGS